MSGIMAPTVLITGAAGRTSGFVIGALLASKANLNLRLFVRSEAAVKRVRAKFPQLKREAFALGDYLECSTLGPAFKDVDIVFHNGPGFHSQETAMGIALVDAACEAGVKHFVYCSVLFPLLHKLVNHEVKLRCVPVSWLRCRACADIRRRVEEYLIESGLNYTILEVREVAYRKNCTRLLNDTPQPTCLMQNIDVPDVVAHGVLDCLSNPEVLQGYVALQDVSEIAKLVILDPEQHNRARYELVGQNITLEELAQTIGRVAGKASISARQLPREQVIPRIWSPYKYDGFDRMLYYYDRRYVVGVVCRVPG